MDKSWNSALLVYLGLFHFGKYKTEKDEQILHKLKAGERGDFQEYQFLVGIGRRCC